MATSGAAQWAYEKYPAPWSALPQFLAKAPPRTYTSLNTVTSNTTSHQHSTYPAGENDPAVPSHCASDTPGRGLQEGGAMWFSMAPHQLANIDTLKFTRFLQHRVSLQNILPLDSLERHQMKRLAPTL